MSLTICLRLWESRESWTRWPCCLSLNICLRSTSQWGAEGKLRPLGKNQAVSALYECPLEMSDTELTDQQWRLLQGRFPAERVAMTLGMVNQAREILISVSCTHLCRNSLHLCRNFIITDKIGTASVQDAVPRLVQKASKTLQGCQAIDECSCGRDFLSKRDRCLLKRLTKRETSMSVSCIPCGPRFLGMADTELSDNHSCLSGESSAEKALMTFGIISRARAISMPVDSLSPSRGHHVPSVKLEIYFRLCSCLLLHQCVG